MSVVDAAWPVPYVGYAYAATGEGPEAWNCWAFCRHVHLKVFGVELPYFEDPDSLTRSARIIREQITGGSWMRVEQPRDGDVVMLAMVRVPTHVGLYASTDGGGVLHCYDGVGSVFHTLRHLRLLRWRIEGFYRLRAGTGPAGAA